MMLPGRFFIYIRRTWEEEGWLVRIRWRGWWLRQSSSHVTHLPCHTIFLFDLPAFQKDIHIIVIFFYSLTSVHAA